MLDLGDCGLERRLLLGGQDLIHQRLRRAGLFGGLPDAP
jgi:hypothetical protein